MTDDKEGLDRVLPFADDLMLSDSSSAVLEEVCASACCTSELRKLVVSLLLLLLMAPFDDLMLLVDMEFKLYREKKNDESGVCMV